MKNTRYSKKLTLAWLKHKISSSDTYALRALVWVYGKQSEGEKRGHTTQLDNGVGFTAFDAAFLTSLAEQYTKRGHLSPKQVAGLRKKMTRYAAQIMRHTPLDRLHDSMDKCPMLTQTEFSDLQPLQNFEN